MLSVEPGHDNYGSNVYDADDTDTYCDYSHNLFLISCIHGNLECVKLCIEDGIVYVSEGCLEAYKHNNIQIVHYLIREYYTSFMFPFSDRYTLRIIESIVKNDDTETLKIIKDEGPKFCKFICRLAIQENKIKSLEFLYDNLPKISQKCYNSHAKLSSNKGNITMVKFIFERGANNYDDVIDGVQRRGCDDIVNLVTEYKNIKL